MLVHLSCFLLSFLLAPALQAAGAPPCFNCETYEHQGAPVLNQAFINYGPLEIRGRHAAIPSLAAGVYPLGVSLMSHGVPPILWQHGGGNLAGGPLTILEACVMANDRQALGINVNFQHLAAILAVAAGLPPAVAAGLAAMAPGPFAAYLNRALGGGGYFAHQAAAIYRLRHNVPQPNFVWLILPGAAAPANCVVLQFHNTIRMSKNLKELSHNSLIAPGVGGLGYLSIKDIINNQLAVFGLPAPSSATVVSADFLQPE